MMLRRNQVIITALVVMIAVAGYLNYADGKKDGDPIALNENGEIGALVGFDETGAPLSDASYYGEATEIGDALTMDDNGNIISPDYDYAVQTGSTTGIGEEASEAVFVNTTRDSSFFVQAKLEREQARSKQKDILMGLINDEKIDQDKRAVCAEAMLEIQKRIEKETAAEAMIESKGFKEVYVRIDDSTVDVVVNKDALSDAEIAQIEDIVKRKTGMNAEQIRISAMRK